MHSEAFSILRMSLAIEAQAGDLCKKRRVNLLDKLYTHLPLSVAIGTGSSHDPRC